MRHAPEEIVHKGHRKLGRAFEASVVRVDVLEQADGSVLHQRQRKTIAQLFVAVFAQRLDQGRTLFADVVAHVAPHTIDLGQDFGKARAAIGRLRGEIGAAPKRGAIGRQEYGQRPAAMFAEQRERLLVNRVEVGAFLPVDLDVHEQAVHLRRDVGVLKTFMGHHVAPMASRVSD